MSSELRNRDWFAKYREDKKFIFNQSRGRITHTNPVFKASVSECLTLIMIKNGFDHETTALILESSKNVINNQMKHLKDANHCQNGKLFRKAKTLGLDNPMALIGLAVRFKNQQKKERLLKQIDLAAKALNRDLLERKGQAPYDGDFNTVPVPND